MEHGHQASQGGGPESANPRNRDRPISLGTETRLAQAQGWVSELGRFRFENLVFIKSWRGSLAAIVASVIVLFFAFGFWWPYWRIADMDLWMIYEAWLFNDGLSQEWFDHPGYLTICLLGEWFRLLHTVGLLDVHALSELPTLQQGADQAWTAAARAGRVLSLLLAIAYLLGFTELLRRVTKSWQIAALAGFFLAFSGGFAMSARIMRTELLAGGAVTIALLILIIAARTPMSNWRPILIGLAAFCATLGVINKIQVIYLACALPIAVLPFGIESKSGNFWRTSRFALLAVVALMAFAVPVTAPAIQLIRTGLEAASAVPGWTPFLLKTYGAYQVLIVLAVAGSIVAFATYWRVSAVETFATAACLLAGISCALLTLELRYNPQNVVVVINPLEQLAMWGKASNPTANDLLGITKLLFDGLRVVLVTRTFIFDTSSRPTIFLEWFVLAGSILAWRAGNRAVVVQVAMLMLMDWSMDAISAIRGLKQQYFILTDPLVITAAALLLAQQPSLVAHRWAFRVGIGLMVLHVAISQSEPVKHTFLTSKPLDFCVEHFGYTKRIERFPFCLSPG